MEKGEYACPISEKTTAPYIYVDDSIEATMMLLRAPQARLSRTTYQVAGISFSAEQWCNAVKKLLPKLKLTYQPDFRDAIVKSWTNSLDDSDLCKDVDWKYEITVE
jgi:nucleoside-diphosphate-sugar epimerase